MSIERVDKLFNCFKSLLFVFFYFILFKNSYSQNGNLSNKIVVEADVEKKKLSYNQKVKFKNIYPKTLNYIYLYSWVNSVKNNTPFANERIFAEKDDLYWSKYESQGDVIDLKIDNSKIESYNFLKDHPDVLEIKLSESLIEGDSIEFELSYVVKVPDSKYTEYGIYEDKWHLKYTNFYLSSFIGDQWVYYSRKMEEDISILSSEYDVSFSIPKDWELHSNLSEKSVYESGNSKVYNLSSPKEKEIEFVLFPKKSKIEFANYKIDDKTILTEFSNNEVEYDKKIFFLENHIKFLARHLLPLGDRKILINKKDLKDQGFLGVEVISFLKAFSDEFLWDIKIFKAIASKYLKEIMDIDYRKNSWIYKGILNFLEVKYIQENYPGKKIVGALSNWFFINSFHFSDVKFNERHKFSYLYMARKGLDQPISTPLDSLSFLNRSGISGSKAALGFLYLEDYLGQDKFQRSLKDFILNSSNPHDRSSDLEEIKKSLLSNSDKNTDWFFGDFLNTQRVMDFELSHVENMRDSTYISVKNKGISVPFKVLAFKDDKVSFSKWYYNSTGDKNTMAIPNIDYDKIQVNDAYLTSEYSFSDNVIYPKKFFQRSWSIGLFGDMTKHDAYQTFITPNLDWNNYDKLLLGLEINNNRIVVPSLFEYLLRPYYSSGTSKLSGVGSFSYSWISDNDNFWREIKANYNFSYLHYDVNMPYFRQSFGLKINLNTPKNNTNLYSNVILRYLYIEKERKKSVDVDKVFNARYTLRKYNILYNYYYEFDLKASRKFVNIHLDHRSRIKYMKDNRVSYRVYLGAFLYNNTTDDYYSFSLGNSRDYLFDHKYFGRSAKEGFLSQQFIISEGGFKIKNSEFANRFIASLNTTITLWKWMELYGDLAYLKRDNQNEKYFYETGIRLNLVEDFLEFYFPLKSSIVENIFTKNYYENIRFVITLNLGKIIAKLSKGYY
ncbi:gluzincin family metallopeptidase [Ichthyobacterium seriolicida]|uniref:Aminopeptidase N n=1 Tax=Ichthyobacterium seriolicida TaxID=242600 RepID=A0A1J1E6P1_9FLAO|nr:hypothetical protein [Ichthyobacterium seriolicida]BAV95006.1 hypothetical protein JBKA6_0993 [Ichthyobacterium seriolicida]